MPEEVRRMDAEGAAQAPVDPAPVLAEELVELRKERDALHDRLLRQAAEFDNYRKRIERERKDMVEYATVEFLQDLLPVIDDFERALQAETPGAEAYRQGLEIIHRALMEMLRRRGVTTIEAVGTDFDPHVHQAVAHEDAPDKRMAKSPGVQARYPAGRSSAIRPDGKGGEGVSKRDYYDVLGVPKTADDQKIKSAYRRLAMDHHPDRNPGNKDAEEKFKEAAEAYAILSDSEKRSRYDRFGHAGVSSQAGAGFDPSTFAGFEDIFGGIFGDIFGGGARRGGPERGSDLRYDLEIRFEESAKGVETTIKIPRLEPCETCHGSGAAAGSSPSTCPQCQAEASNDSNRVFTVAVRGRCRGTGRIINKHHHMQGRRANAARATADGEGSRGSRTGNTAPAWEVKPEPAAAGRRSAVFVGRRAQFSGATATINASAQFHALAGWFDRRAHARQNESVPEARSRALRSACVKEHGRCVG